MVNSSDTGSSRFWDPFDSRGVGISSGEPNKWMFALKRRKASLEGRHRFKTFILILCFLVMIALPLMGMSFAPVYFFGGLFISFHIFMQVPDISRERYRIKQKYNDLAASYIKFILCQEKQWAYTEHLVYRQRLKRFETIFAPIGGSGAVCSLKDGIWGSYDSTFFHAFDVVATHPVRKIMREDTHSVIVFPIRFSLPEKFVIGIGGKHKRNIPLVSEKIPVESVILENHMRCAYHFSGKLEAEKIQSMLTPKIQHLMLELLSTEKRFSLFFSQNLVAFATPKGFLESLNSEEIDVAQAFKTLDGRFQKILELAGEISESFKKY